MEENNKKQDTKYLRIVLLLMIFIVAISLITITVLYNYNKDFKDNIDEILLKMPGPIGEYFRKHPTEEEKNEKLNYLSRHFLDIESEAAADKIYIIKKEDEELYYDLIKEMNSVSAKKTEDIVIKIRNMELRKNILVSTYEEVIDEKYQKNLLEVSRIENQDVLLSIMEVESKYSNNDFVETLNKVEINKLSKILYYVDESIRDYLLENLDLEKRNEIRRLIYVMEREEKSLEDIAKIYETKSVESGLKEISSLENYNISELAAIYMNLSNVKASKLLYNFEDEKLVEDIFVEIERQKEMKKLEGNTIENISKAMEFISDYNSKLENLVETYEKMNPGQVAKIVENMIRNDNTIMALTLDDEEVYTLSETSIIIDVLLKMKHKTLSEILESMNTENASKLTEKLAKPDLNN